MRNSSVGGGDLRNSGMRVAEGCLERKLLKRGVISVMFADCGKFRGYVLPSLSVYLFWGLGKLGCRVIGLRVIHCDYEKKKKKTARLAGRLGVSQEEH